MNATAAADKQWFGHPRGLSTLFFTEMWERFSFYGLRAMLILYMTSSVAETNPGLGFSESKSGAILGLYTAGVYLLALPGGWLADRILGPRRSVFIGGVIIAAGHFSLAVPAVPTFYLGLILIVVGTGLLKPNVSTIVGEMYPQGGARRDAGFSVFYMGINIGAFAGPLICGTLGENYNWHLGFGLAGIGMVAGLIQYSITQHYLGGAGHLKVDATETSRAKDLRTFGLAVGGVLVAIAAIVLAWQQGALTLTSEGLAISLGILITCSAFFYFAYQFVFGRLAPVEKKGLGMIAILFVFSAVFWGGFEQASSSMNLFADRLTDRVVFGWEIPTTALQAVNPLFIILLAPVFGMIWQWLGRRDRDPSMPAKFSMGLLLLGVGFLVMVWAAVNTNGGDNKVLPTWLVAAYFFHTCGELCLSPVGLSSITKLAPARLVGQMMGIWFMATSLGNLMAGIAGGQFGTLSTVELFKIVTIITMGGGLVLLLVVLGRWTSAALDRAESDLTLETPEQAAVDLTSDVPT